MRRIGTSLRYIIDINGPDLWGVGGISSALASLVLLDELGR